MAICGSRMSAASSCTELRMAFTRFACAHSFVNATSAGCFGRAELLEGRARACGELDSHQWHFLRRDAFDRNGLAQHVMGARRGGRMCCSRDGKRGISVKPGSGCWSSMSGMAASNPLMPAQHGCCRGAARSALDDVVRRARLAWRRYPNFVEAVEFPLGAIRAC